MADGDVTPDRAATWPGNWEWRVLIRTTPEDDAETHDWYGTDDQAAKDMAMTLRAQGRKGSWAWADYARRRNVL